MVSSELIYLGCKGGSVEVWCKEKHNRVETLQVGTSAKVLTMAVNSDEEILVAGTSDGRILVHISITPLYTSRKRNKKYKPLGTISC